MPLAEFLSVLELDNQRNVCSLVRGQVIPADRIACGARDAVAVAVSTKPNAGNIPSRPNRQRHQFIGEITPIELQLFCSLTRSLMKFLGGI